MTSLSYILPLISTLDGWVVSKQWETQRIQELDMNSLLLFEQPSDIALYNQNSLQLCSVASEPWKGLNNTQTSPTQTYTLSEK